MKNLLTGAMLMLALSTAPQAGAGAILYSTTDLGAGSQVEKDVTGHIYGLANASGSVIYAFDKAPVAQIHEVVDTHDPRSYEILTLQSGSYKVGVWGGEVAGTGVIWPSFGYNSNWGIPGNLPGRPVSDLNVLGQVVGMGYLGTGLGAKPFATFSEPGLQIHFFPNPPLKDYPNGFAGGREDDNLNDYIAPIPGVSLISASLIDDVGRIVARGDNGHDYLLTPAAVPEPPSWMMLAMAGGLLVARAAHRWRRGR